MEYEESIEKLVLNTLDTRILKRELAEVLSVRSLEVGMTLPVALMHLRSHALKTKRCMLCCMLGNILTVTGW